MAPVIMQSRRSGRRPRQGQVAPDVRSPRIDPRIDVDLEMRTPAEQLFEDDARLQARRGGTDAVVRAVTQREDLVDRALDVELFRGRPELPVVAVRWMSMTRSCDRR